MFTIKAFFVLLNAVVLCIFLIIVAVSVFEIFRKKNEAKKIPSTINIQFIIANKKKEESTHFMLESLHYGSRTSCAVNEDKSKHTGGESQSKPGEYVGACALAQSDHVLHV